MEEETFGGSPFVPDTGVQGGSILRTFSVVKDNSLKWLLAAAEAAFYLSILVIIYLVATNSTASPAEKTNTVDNIKTWATIGGIGALVSVLGSFYAGFNDGVRTLS